ncbi:hypothetical protein DCE93_09745 [Agromyces badenianii]|uniref:Polysaccharide biosynthesis protein n=1 Tax=Agromyces badenianii TaxID=2080742 RepID=A0A2S0WXA7_9MICO|nr:oligosaccharide flippase family protein [Agromyces badenianii]AWB95910.1 hypothetical protein DCE93_09745 [Agromyces badenianii]
MTDGSERDHDAPAEGGGGHLRTHAKGLSAIAIATIVGVLASFVFQIVSARYLAPAEFGLLAAFFVVVNVAAIGSSSLQNLVTVHTASALTTDGAEKRWHRWPVDALVLGGIGLIVVAALSPVLAQSLDTQVWVILAAAACIPLSFLFAQYLGLLQGSGRVASAVWWSTQSLVIRVALTFLVVLIGLGLSGVIGAVVAATLVALIGAWWAARNIPRPVQGAFSAAGLTIIVLTVSFAWLTSSDVLLLRAGASETLAGQYAAVAVLVKAAFLLPSTLSLYLLPRFVRNRDNPRLMRLGVLATAGLAAVTGIALVLFFLLFGPLVISLLYGSAYEQAAELLVPVSLAYLPWIVAQGMLIRMTASASKVAATVLVLSVAGQWIAFTSVIPDVGALLVSQAVIGSVVLIAFIAVEFAHARTASQGENR